MLFLFYLDWEGDGKKRADNEMNKIFEECNAAAMNYDFVEAHQLLSKLETDYLHNADTWDYPKKKKRYEEAFDLVFNTEAMYLCSKGDKESINRIVFLLSSIRVEGEALPEGTKYHKKEDLGKHETGHNDYIKYATRFNQKCNTLIDLAISNHRYDLALKVLPLIKEIPEPIKKEERDIDAENDAKSANPSRSTPRIYIEQTIQYSKSDIERANKKIQEAFRDEPLNE